jgi:phage tail tape-measure protein
MTGAVWTVGAGDAKSAEEVGECVGKGVYTRGLVASIVGDNVGDAVGVVVGVAVGAAVGVAVGTAEGFSVGSADGGAVGTTDGDWDGFSVGVTTNAENAPDPEYAMLPMEPPAANATNRIDPKVSAWDTRREEATVFSVLRLTDVQPLAAVCDKTKMSLSPAHVHVQIGLRREKKGNLR